MHKISDNKIVSKINWLLLWISLSIRLGGKFNKLITGKKSILWLGSIIVSGNNNNVFIGDNVRLKRLKIRIKGNNNKIKIGQNVRIYEYADLIIEANDGYIEIGHKTTIGSATLYVGENMTGVSIGQDCMLSRNIVIDTSDFHSIISLKTNERINPPKSVSVSNHVWIGNGVYLGKGSKINDNCIIATRSVVSGKEFPSNVILGGIPAKIIKDEITWSREKLPYEILQY